MRQTLFYIPHEIAGIPVFGFGWALAAWIVLCALGLAWLVRRQGFNAETRGYLPLMVIAGAALVWLLPLLEQRLASGEVAGLPVRAYGAMMLAGIGAGLWLACHQARRVGLGSDTVLSMAFWMVGAGFVGARLAYVTHYWERFDRSTWWETALEVLKITEGGLIVYGSVVGGLLAWAAYCHFQRLPMLAIGDLMAPSLLVGLALGRIGCLLNGCCYGGPAEPPALAVTFPRYSNEVTGELSPPYHHQQSQGLLHGLRLGETARDGEVMVAWVEPGSAAERAGLTPGTVVRAIDGRPLDGLLYVRGVAIEVSPLEQARLLLAQAGPALRVSSDAGRQFQWSVGRLPSRSLPVHPTQIYAAVNAALLALLLFAAFAFRTRDGQVFALMVTLYPITRFLLEAIRTDEGALGGTRWTLSQWISLAMLVVAAGLWAVIQRRPRGASLAIRGIPGR